MIVTDEQNDIDRSVYFTCINDILVHFQIYKEHLLEKVLQILLSPGQKYENGEQKKNDISDALYYIDLLKDNITIDAKAVFGANPEKSKYSLLENK